MSHTVNGGGPRPVSERSTSELVQDASEQISRLVRDELMLARTELTEKGRHAGMGVGLFGAGGLVALFGAAVLVVAAVAGLAVALPTWLAALIIGGALLIIAALMALAGRDQVRRATPPMPTSSVSSMRADMDSVSTAVRSRGRS